jgi:hypothetical protein
MRAKIILNPMIDTYFQIDCEEKIQGLRSLPFQRKIRSNLEQSYCYLQLNSLKI